MIICERSEMSANMLWWGGHYIPRRIFRSGGNQPVITWIVHLILFWNVFRVFDNIKIIPKSCVLITLRHRDIQSKFYQTELYFYLTVHYSKFTLNISFWIGSENSIRKTFLRAAKRRALHEIHWKAEFRRYFFYFR